MSTLKRAAFALLVLGFRIALGVAEVFRRQPCEASGAVGTEHDARQDPRGRPPGAVPLTYAIITPAHNEATTLPELAQCLCSQTHLPESWLIVENGSTDGTVSVATELATETPWIRVVVVPETGKPERGAPIVRALHAGIDALRATPPDVVVNVDADVTMDEEYFARLVERFEIDPGLGIASGRALEPDGSGWRRRHVTGGTVWGATRAYRWSCLEMVTPLVPRHGWDGIDQLKARAVGWRTATFPDLHFRHHRPEGSRDGSGWAHWRLNGETAHYMGYRPSYLIARVLHQSRRDALALGLFWGYATAALRRRPTLADPGARAVLRDDQRLRNLRRRRREALGRG